jgi:hypothetical protein
MQVGAGRGLDSRKFLSRMLGRRRRATGGHLGKVMVDLG